MGGLSNLHIALRIAKLMKLIGILQGVAAYREIAEEYIPEIIPPLQNVVQLVRGEYQFQQFPVFAPNMPPAAITILNFNNGRFIHGETTLGITQLVMTPKGDSVAAASTDQADLVLEHLIDMLDAKLGYRLRQSTKTKIYWSHVVIEFDKGIEQYIDKFASAEEIITKRAAKGAFKLKGLNFSTSTSTSQGQPIIDPIDFLDAQDFIIERRVDYPFDQNRFFSSAPLSTKAHIEALQEIEATFRT